MPVLTTPRARRSVRMAPPFAESLTRGGAEPAPYASDKVLYCRANVSKGRLPPTEFLSGFEKPVMGIGPLWRKKKRPEGWIEGKELL